MHITASYHLCNILFDQSFSIRIESTSTSRTPLAGEGRIQSIASSFQHILVSTSLSTVHIKACMCVCVMRTIFSKFSSCFCGLYSFVDMFIFLSLEYRVYIKSRCHENVFPNRHTDNAIYYKSGNK
jgi:hypothetical protein